MPSPQSSLRISTWLRSVESPTIKKDNKCDCQHDLNPSSDDEYDNDRPAKRRRCDSFGSRPHRHDDRDSPERRHRRGHPAKRPRPDSPTHLSSPPITMPASPAKRSASELDQPTAATVSVSRSQLQPFPIAKRSAPRSRSTSPTKRDNLELFEKPVRVKPLDHRSLPSDLKTLYPAIKATCRGEGVIPFEVKDRVIEREGEESAPPFFLRHHPTPGADARYDDLVDILSNAEVAAIEEHHESSWNCIVHTPVFRTVFSQRPPEPSSTSPQARVVTTMATSIWQPYVPVKFANSTLVLSGMPDDLMSAASSSKNAATTANWSTTTGGAKDQSGIQDYKKVDYVLALEPAAPLRKVLQKLAYTQASEQKGLPHINQTIYTPLKHAPIAVSVETKAAVGAQDSMLQLGTWIAAWHKRMQCHRDFLFRRVPEAMSEEVQLALLPSTLLVDVVGHDWKLYFACDRRDDIELCGPLNIGGTESLTDLYRLVAALEAIKTWIEGPFQEEIKRWFAFEKLKEE